MSRPKSSAASVEPVAPEAKVEIARERNGRFTAGRCPNPTGRRGTKPKRRLSVLQQMLAVFDDPIPVGDGSEVSLSVALLKRACRKALEDDAKLSLKLIDLRAKLAAMLPPDAAEALSDEQAEALMRVLRRRLLPADLGDTDPDL